MAETAHHHRTNDVTLDVPPSSGSSVLDDRDPRPVAFVEGSRPKITTETTSLLRSRLRAAAGILFLAFGLFFVYRLVTGSGPGGSDNLTFYLHALVTLVLGLSFVRLCQWCEIPMGILRAYEAAIFGLPVIYFVLYDHRLMTLMVRHGFLPNPLAFWMGIIFTYAIFIPNSWRRAAVVIGLITLAPLALIGYMAATDPIFRNAIVDSSGFLVEMTIMLGITYLCSVYGTYTINTLRTEAFAAKQLGQYRLCQKIGAGGMGEVYLAEHQLMKRPCAIKLIRPSKAADPHALARFEREVRATAKLSHWNTVEIFDYGRADDGTFYYVMEYLPGLSLADLVEKHGPLSPARAIHLLIQTCDALAEAHSHGLIHRDIKPGNIFAAERGGVHDVAKLLDFGLAKPLSAETESVHLTQEGAIAGSPMFMSPEQALGDSEPDARSDVYSWAPWPITC